MFGSSLLCSDSQQFLLENGYVDLVVNVIKVLYFSAQVHSRTELCDGLLNSKLTQKGYNMWEPTFSNQYRPFTKINFSQDRAAQPKSRRLVSGALSKVLAIRRENRSQACSKSEFCTVNSLRLMNLQSARRFRLMRRSVPVAKIRQLRASSTNETSCD